MEAVYGESCSEKTMVYKQNSQFKQDSQDDEQTRSPNDVMKVKMLIMENCR